MTMTIGCPIPGASQPKKPVRLIDANKVMDALNNAEIELYRSEYENFQKEIDKIPTIDPESLRPTAQWDGEYDGYADGNPVYDVWSCSSCGYSIDDGTDDPELLPKFCPGCGARMVNK